MPSGETTYWIILGSPIKKTLNELSAICQENAASSEEVTATTQSVNEAIQGINKDMGMVKNISEDLAELMKYFKIK